VLRVYSNQLKKKNTFVEDQAEPNAKYADVVDISLDARRKQMLNRMSKQLISQVSPKDPGQESPQKSANFSNILNNNE
jgi:hypothetical protein